MSIRPGGGSPSSPGASLTVQDEGTSVDTATTVLNFVGTTVTASDASAGHVTVSVTGASTTQTITQQSGTTYTLALADAGTDVEATNASAVTVTVPTNASVAFPVGSIVNVRQYGAGQVTLAAAGGVTLRTPNGARTAKQYSTVSLTKRATDEWIVSGDTTV